MLVYKEEAYTIMGACFAVYNKMGNGFLEAVYQECLGIEFHFRGIPHDVQPQLRLQYRGQILEKTYRLDFVVYGGIILEIKAVSALNGDHVSQVLNYLHATKYKLGLLVNFGSADKIEYKRIVL
jgi:GxxExxY protein